MNAMLCCQALGCNRKYKTFERLEKHMIKDHNQLPPEASSVQAVPIDRKNPNAASRQKDREIQQREFQERKARLEQEKMTAEEARREALERVKASANEEVLKRLEQDYECPVCYESNPDSVIDPCGHVFCYDCANKAAGVQGVCPGCRGPIIKVIKPYRL